MNNLLSLEKMLQCVEELGVLEMLLQDANISLVSCNWFVSGNGIMFNL